MEKGGVKIGKRWIDIIGFEGRYQINRLGQVRSLGWVANNYPNCTRKIKGRILKPMLGNLGYYLYRLSHSSGKGINRTLHRLKAIHFLPNPDNLPCINHIDGVKTNNDFSNLEWCTHQQNMKHAFDMGLIPKRINLPGEDSMSAKLTNKEVQQIKKRIQDGERSINIAKDYIVSVSAIYEIKAGRSWGHIEI